MFEQHECDLGLLNKDEVNYAKSLIEKVDFSSIIEFRDDFLGGNWSEKYGLVLFNDERQKGKLDSWSKIVIDLQNVEEVNVFNFPYSIIESIINPLITQNRYFSNHDIIDDKKQGDFLTITTDNDIQSLDLSLWEEHKCSTSSLTTQQYHKVLMEIYKMDNSEEILKFRQDKIELSIKDSIEKSRVIAPHQERPFLLSILGNDDCSYYKTFATKEEAFDCYQELKNKSKTESSYDLVNRLGFLAD